MGLLSVLMISWGLVHTQCNYSTLSGVKNPAHSILLSSFIPAPPSLSLPSSVRPHPLISLTVVSPAGLDYLHLAAAEYGDLDQK